ncbi:MAG: hypothetical protein ACE5I5_13255 [Candidatus Heimdallarchaeota archaeon]
MKRPQTSKKARGELLVLSRGTILGLSRSHPSVGTLVRLGTPAAVGPRPPESGASLTNELKIYEGFYHEI